MEIGGWERPTTFETTKLGKYWAVTSTAEAPRALMDRWPVDTGEALQKAQQTCLDVLEGKTEPSEARRAFLIAAKEAEGSIFNRRRSCFTPASF
ncbi:DUF982 domain-containing protein [Shinella sp. CPCC 101442]|uniref:DUF982 domain-containing protein n=1 Tax=Shinella sp. CPCC 101442 TaxID=2932265 RepID=UPI0021535C84|nr:DUF982 domain-containing protein [Shinella sp. CPCC 101442]MCR6502616.1 DUF982 domain-containing protein [Shinella sp. CPCC 101442]